MSQDIVYKANKKSDLLKSFLRQFIESIAITRSYDFTTFVGEEDSGWAMLRDSD